MEARGGAAAGAPGGEELESERGGGMKAEQWVQLSAGSSEDFYLSFFFPRLGDLL